MNGLFLKTSKSLRPRESIAAPRKFSPSYKPGAKLSGTAFETNTNKRKRDDRDDEDADSLLSRFISPAAEKPHSTLTIPPAKLSEHVVNNVVLLFYPHTAGSPRVRLLRQCDSVQKLFAQALAGDVFADGVGTGTRVLALTFGGGQQKVRSLVEDDDQDYEDLVTSLKALDCWFLEDGICQGILTVEVRAK
jgi:hypothetical protein